MRAFILHTSAAALLAIAPAAIAEEKQPANTTTSTSASVTATSDGTATVIIDVDGKKEVRTFKLDDKPLTLKFPETKGAAHGEKQKETWIGVGMGGPVSEDVRAQLPIQQGEGITVSHVSPDSPAAKAGVAEHDILVRLDDQILVSGEQLKTLVKMRKPGDTVKVGLFRKGERKDIEVTLEEHEVQAPGPDLMYLLRHPEKLDLKGVPLEGWKNRLEKFRDQSELLRDKLREAKERFPGVIVDKRAWFLDPDGTVKKIEGEVEIVSEVIRDLAEKLEKSNIPKETIDEVRGAVEKAIRKAGDAVQDAAIEAIRDYRVKKDTRERLQEKPAPPIKVAPPPVAAPAPPPPPPAPPTPVPPRPSA